MAEASGTPRRGLKLARAYVPYQRFGRIWSPIEGLRRGTIFPELYDEYRPRR